MSRIRELWTQRYGQDVEDWPELESAGPAIETLLAHRSVRAFLDQPLPPGTLELLIAAAQSAPSSSNLQVWSVIAVEDRARHRVHRSAPQSSRSDSRRARARTRRVRAVRLVRRQARPRATDGGQAPSLAARRAPSRAIRRRTRRARGRELRSDHGGVLRLAEARPAQLEQALHGTCARP
jgi:nitroreductase